MNSAWQRFPGATGPVTPKPSLLTPQAPIEPESCPAQPRGAWPVRKGVSPRTNKHTNVPSERLWKALKSCSGSVKSKHLASAGVRSALASGVSSGQGSVEEPWGWGALAERRPKAFHFINCQECGSGTSVPEAAAKDPRAGPWATCTVQTGLLRSPRHQPCTEPAALRPLCSGDAWGWLLSSPHKYSKSP